MNSPNVQVEPVERLLQEPQGNWQGYITSHEDCMEMRKKLSSTRIVDVDQEENVSDDFPYTAEAKMVCAFQLWEAMTDYSDFIESKDEKNHFQVDRLKAMSEVEMEVLAWELLHAIENAHRGSLGFTATPEGVERKKTWHYSSFGSFGARFEEVKRACRTSKSIVYNLTLTPFMLNLTADPKRELDSKIANKIINDRRAQAKRSAAEKAKHPGERSEEGDNGGISNAGGQTDRQTRGAKAAGQPKPKAKPVPRQSLNATRGGRVAKATGQRGQKLPNSGAVQVALAGNLNIQVPGPSVPPVAASPGQDGGNLNVQVHGSSVPPVVAKPGQDRAALYGILQTPLEPLERDVYYQKTVRSLLDKMGHEIS